MTNTSATNMSSSGMSTTTPTTTPVTSINETPSDYNLTSSNFSDFSSSSPDVNSSDTSILLPTTVDAKTTTYNSDTPPETVAVVVLSVVFVVAVVFIYCFIKRRQERVENLYRKNLECKQRKEVEHHHEESVYLDVVRATNIELAETPGEKETPYITVEFSPNNRLEEEVGLVETCFNEIDEVEDTQL